MNDDWLTESEVRIIQRVSDRLKRDSGFVRQVLVVARDPTLRSWLLTANQAITTAHVNLDAACSISEKSMTSLDK